MTDAERVLLLAVATEIVRMVKDPAGKADTARLVRLMREVERPAPPAIGA
jgi:hypothetical protein